MLFNSLEYLQFFFIVLTTSWALIGLPKLRIWLLLLASYYFYASNNQWLIVLILFSTQIDFLAGKRIAKTTDRVTKKLWLVASIVSNIGILALFKYFNFFASTVAMLSSLIGLKLDWVDLNIVLPVGISFYTFQSMSYTIDVYCERIEPEKSWSRFAFYVSFFPQLIAGPIIRASIFLPQTYQRPKVDLTDIENALYRIFRGLFKKIVLADLLAVYADTVFSNPSSVDSLTAWVGLYAFAFQIYFDFSAYTDIAIGSARLLGYDFPENFNRPYVAPSLSKFWRRWHISLSSWLRDYLYIPLGGNRMKTNMGTYRNLMITMLLGGLWHGAAWHFVFWGGLHGCYLITERILAEAAIHPLRNANNVIRTLFTFHLVLLAWMLFRVENNQHLVGLLQTLLAFDYNGSITYGMLLTIFIVIGNWLCQYLGEKGWLNDIEWFSRMPVTFKAVIYACVSIIVLIMNSESPQPFIYFKF